MGGKRRRWYKGRAHPLDRLASPRVDRPIDLNLPSTALLRYNIGTREQHPFCQLRNGPRSNAADKFTDRFVPTFRFETEREREQSYLLLDEKRTAATSIQFSVSPRCSPLSMLVTSDTCSIRRSEVSSKEENRGNLANRRKERKKKEKSRLKQRAIDDGIV